MPHGIGVDIIEIERIEEAIARWGGRFLQRVYTEAELAYCRGRVSELAVRFAGKEAVMKALGTGIQGGAGSEIVILRDRGGSPTVTLYCRARKRAEKLGLTCLDISLSHSKMLAVASAVGDIS